MVVRLAARKAAPVRDMVDLGEAVPPMPREATATVGSVNRCYPGAVADLEPAALVGVGAASSGLQPGAMRSSTASSLPMGQTPPIVVPVVAVVAAFGLRRKLSAVPV